MTRVKKTTRKRERGIKKNKKQASVRERKERTWRKKRIKMEEI